MATQPEPHNIPRIIEVLDPGANQHAVTVLMPTHLAAKYPNKAWGIGIDQIGLAKKDSDLFVDYVLVDFESLKGSSDLLWIFQKLSGPIWTTTTVGSDNIIPEKFRSQVTQTKTEQEVTPDTAPTAITGDLISSTIADEKNTGKSWKIDVSEGIIESATALVTPSLEDQLYVTTEILVAEGTVPDTGTGVIESVVQAIGRGKAIKTSRFAVTSYTNKTTYTVGYATLLDFTEGSADSIPAKFKALKALKTWRFRVQAATPPATPALGTGTGDYAGYDIVERAIKQTQENGSTDVFQMVIVGLSNTGANSLASSEYGKIVSTTGTETLALTADVPVETGIEILSSVTEELGNGLSVRKTDQVVSWPATVENEIGIEATNKPPARYLRDLTRATSTSKVASVPASVSLSAGEVAKIYKKENPDRTDVSITTESLTLNTTAINESVEQKPFVRITSVMTPGPTKVSPVNRNGSSRIVYENGSTEIWENTEEIAVAREGPAGTDKDSKPFVEITTNKRYSLDPTINTSSGGSDVIFNDGTTLIYEVKEIESSGRYGPAGTEQQTKPFVKITSEMTYEEEGLLDEGEVGNTKKIYDDGDTVVYEKTSETAEVIEGPSGIEQNVKPFVAIRTDKRYTADPTINTPSGSSNVVFNDGKVQVHEVSEVNSTGRYGPAGVEQQAKPFLKILNTKEYAPDGDIPEGQVGTSNKIYDDGDTVVYDRTIETAEAIEGLKGVETNAQAWGAIRATTHYTTSDVAPSGGSVQLIYKGSNLTMYESTTTEPSILGQTVDVDSQPWGRVRWDGLYESAVGGERSRQVWSNGVQQVYLNENPTLIVNGTSIDVDPNAWGSVRWTGTYATTSSGMRSRKITQIGDTEVFLNEDATLTIVGEPFTSAREENSLLTEVQTSSYSNASHEGVNTRSRVVFSLGELRVYENITITRTAKGARTYKGTVNVDLPPVHEGTQRLNYQRKDGQFKVLYVPRMIAGYRGPMACTVTEYWQQDQNTEVSATVFRPEPVSFDFPAGGGYSLGTCLHGHLSETETINPGHPVYYASTTTIEHAATEPPTWVGMLLLAHVDSQPYRDGFVIREYRVQL